MSEIPPSPSWLYRRVAVDALTEHPDRIDVRSPAEFAHDRIPGAANHPVLDDLERARIGTLHAQEGAFVAKRTGAPLVARRIVTMLETDFATKPREWAPLVYCWRGGQRSRALVHILNEIGWRAVQLDGGYRAYRRHVVVTLLTLPTRFRYRVVCGPTGSGKSRLIAALADEGAQVLDLERIARHRGSLLGELPEDPQPSQKGFESELVTALGALDPGRTVFIESESKRIGSLQLPEALLTAMRASGCVRVETSRELRVALLQRDYAHFLADPEALVRCIAPLTEVHGKATIARWQDAARADDPDLLVADLLERHYDPLYARSITRNFPHADRAEVVRPRAIDEASFRELARTLVDADSLAARSSAAMPVALS